MTFSQKVISKNLFQFPNAIDGACMEKTVTPNRSVKIWIEDIPGFGVKVMINVS